MQNPNKDLIRKEQLLDEDCVFESRGWQLVSGSSSIPWCSIHKSYACGVTVGDDNETKA